MKYKWIFVLVIIVITIIIGYNYIYQDHRNINTEDAQFTLSSKSIKNKFSIDGVSAEKKFLNKTIEIKGDITEITNYDLTLDGNVFCQFTSKMPNNIKKNTSINIKGRCIGYDDLLEVVKLDQCSIIKN